MNKRELLGVFRQENVVDPPDYPRGVALELLTRTARLYEQRGLASTARPEPLWRCCPHGRECWAGATKPRRTSRTNRGTITLPWIGPDYRPGGVALVAINLHNASGLLLEYGIVCSTASSATTLSQIGSFEAGHKRAHRSPFAYGSIRTGAMLLDVLDGAPVQDRDDPTTLIPAINRIARLQAVKCSPDDGERSRPTPAMRRNCPDYLLGAELAILQPRIILTIGAPAQRAIAALPGYSPGAGRGRVKSGTIDAASGPCIVYSIAHPVSTGAWRADHAALTRHLRRQQNKLQ